ncbi:Lipid III flippase [uncultured archaeon]|nr:Lipid III flippase [uncultured archaeon]
MKKDKELAIKTPLKRIAKSSLIVFLGIFISKFLAYFYRIIIARSFGPEEYGLYSLAIMVVGLFAALAGLGLSEGILRFIAVFRAKKEQSKIKHVFGLSLKICFATSIMAGIILFFFAEPISLSIFKNAGLTLYLQILSLVLPFSVLSGILLSTIRAYEKVNWYIIIYYILLNVINFITLLLFLSLNLGRTAIILSYFAGIFFIFISSFFVLRKYSKEVFGKSSLPREEQKKTFREIVKYSWPLIALNLSSYLLTWIDSFSIGIYNGAYDVGIYNVAVPIAGLFVIPSMLFSQLFFPIIVREIERKNHNVVENLSKQVSKWILMLNLPFLGIVLFFPGAIINLLFGAKYLGAENALRMLAIGTFIFQQAAVSKEALYALGKSKKILYNFLFASILNLVLNLLLVPKYGINGAAFSTMLCYIVLAGLYGFQVFRELSVIPLRRKMLTIILINFIPLIALFFVRKIVEITPLSLILITISFVLVYILLIFLTKSFDHFDYEIIRSFYEKSFSFLRRSKK